MLSYNIIYNVCGVPAYYTAPEIIHDEKCSYPADMWSMGIIIYLMIFGYPPFFIHPAFYGKHEKDAIYDQIKKGFVAEIRNTEQVGYGAWFPDHIESSSEVRDLISNLLKTNIKERCSATDALQHPWIQHQGKTKSGKNISNPHIVNQISLSIQGNYTYSIYMQYHTSLRKKFIVLSIN